MKCQVWKSKLLSPMTLDLRSNRNWHRMQLHPLLEFQKYRQASRTMKGVQRGCQHSRGSLSLAAMICFCSWPRLLLLKGGRPASISYTRMPMLHQSTALPCPLPAATHPRIHHTHHLTEEDPSARRARVAYTPLQLSSYLCLRLGG